MSKVYIFLADGFEDIEGLTVVDLMRRAEIDIKTVSIKNTGEVTTSHGITLLTDCVFEETDFSDADMLVLPGGMPGTKYLGEYTPLTELLKFFYSKGGKVAAICAAPSVFADLGFLEGRKATSYPSSTSFLTIPLPIPRLPPVTIAFFRILFSPRNQHFYRCRYMNQRNSFSESSIFFS